MGILTQDELDELAYCEHDTCQNCHFFKYRNAAFRCTHPEINAVLDGVCKCAGRCFISYRFYARGNGERV